MPVSECGVVVSGGVPLPQSRDGLVVVVVVVVMTGRGRPDPGDD